MRTLTTFDVALYSIIYSIATGAPRPPFLACEKIGTRNVKIFNNDEVGKRFAEMTLIAFGEKFFDDELDNQGKGLFFAKLLFGKSIKKARLRQPNIFKITREGTYKINALQSVKANIFEVLGAYGDVIYQSFKEMGVQSDQFLNVFKNIAEWTFFVDMICDYQDDYKNKSYNAFYDKECKTLKELFNKKYAEIIQVNANLSNRIINSLNAVNDDSIEWKVVYRILEYSLNTVLCNLLEGKDVKFHYFKELRKNLKIGSKDENKSNFS